MILPLEGPNGSHQKSKRAKMKLGRTQRKPKLLINEFKISLATLQFIKRWSIVSSAAKHYVHALTTIMLHI